MLPAIPRLTSTRVAVRRFRFGTMNVRYKAALKELNIADRQEVGRWANNRSRTPTSRSDDESGRCGAVRQTLTCLRFGPMGRHESGRGWIRFCSSTGPSPAFPRHPCRRLQLLQHPAPSDPPTDPSPVPGGGALDVGGRDGSGLKHRSGEGLLRPAAVILTVPPRHWRMGEDLAALGAQFAPPTRRRALRCSDELRPKSSQPRPRGGHTP